MIDAADQIALLQEGQSERALRGNSVEVELKGIHVSREALRFDRSWTGLNVAKLLSEGRLAETVQLTSASSDSFAYVLETSPQCKEVRAWWSDFKIGVTLPEQLAQSWGASSQVGIEQTQPVGQNAFLRIVVEKDFACLHPGTDEKETEGSSLKQGGIEK